MLTHHECVLLCAMASNGESKDLRELKGSAKDVYLQRKEMLELWGWAPCLNSEQLGIGSEYGYFGCGYYRFDETGGVEVVIGHRGTCFDEGENILADLAIAEGAEPAILREAVFQYITRLLEQDFYNPDQNIDSFFMHGRRVSKITHTGFSLGGFIAGACVGLSDSTMLEAVTFDAPGIGALNLAMGKPLVGSKIVNYVTTPNLVNTCNEHVGEIRKIVMDCRSSAPEVNFKVEFADLGFGSQKQSFINFNNPNYIEDGRAQGKTKESTTAAFKELNIALNSHDLEKVISAIEGGFRYYKVYKWPRASNKIIYGEEPKTPDSFTSFGFNSFGRALFSTAAIFLQGAKQVGSSVLWGLTKK